MAKPFRLSARSLCRLRRHPVLAAVAAASATVSTDVYLVGGAVRDMFLTAARGTHDFDVVVGSGVRAIARDTARRLGGTAFALDARRQIYRVVSTAPETATLDICLLNGGTLRRDLARRDFTMNALALPLMPASRQSPSVIDYHGGIADIQRRRLRLTRQMNIREDPLRILRAYVFCARFGLTLDPAAEAVMIRQRGLLCQVAPERIREELVKLFTCSDAFSQIQALHAAGILTELLPELCALRGVDQGGFHHCDVFDHSLLTLAAGEKIMRHGFPGLAAPARAALRAYFDQPLCAEHPRRWVVKLACLLHDAGKPRTRTVDAAGKVHFYQHEHYGARIAATLSRRLKLSRAEQTFLEQCVRYHLRPGQLVNRRPSARAVFRLLRDLDTAAPAVIALTAADRQAMRGPLSRKKSFVFLQSVLREIMAQALRRQQRARPVPLLDGHQVMKLLNMPSGPLVGAVLRSIEEAQAMREITTRAQAQCFARQWYAQVCAQNAERN